MPETQPVPPAWRSMRERLCSWPTLAILGFFIADFLLSLPVLFPSLEQVGKFDQSIIIDLGRQMADGRLPTFALNPLVVLLSMLFYLPVEDSPYWLVHVCRIARVGSFSLLWVTTFLVARELRLDRAQWILPALVLVLKPIFMNLELYPTDPWFTACSGLALWQVLKHVHGQRRRNLLGATLFVIAAAFTRNDGMPLIAILTLYGLIAAWRTSGGLRAAVRPMLVSVSLTVLPFCAALLGYVVIFGLSTGSYTLGLEGRTYYAFEQGQGMAFIDRFAGNPYEEGMVDARRVFGTPEENDNSVLRAIARHPKAFAQRTAAMMRQVPDLIVSAYGSGHRGPGRIMGLLVIVLAVRGLIGCIARKQWLLAAALALWPAHLLVYFLTFYRAFYFLLPCFAIVALAALGWASVHRRLRGRTEWPFWLVAFMVIVVAGIVRDNATFVHVGAAFAGGLAIGWLTRERPRLHRASALAPMLILFVLLLVQHGVPSLRIHRVGDSPQEQAVAALRANLPRESPVMVYGPGIVWTANMTPVHIFGELEGAQTTQDIVEWLDANAVMAIVLDSEMSLFRRDIFDAVRAGEGTLFETIYEDAASDTVVLIRRAPTQP